MCHPDERDVAAAILSVVGDPGTNGFKPSRLRQYLENTGRFHAIGAQLSAQIQPHLTAMRHRDIIQLHPRFNQRRNRPYEVIDYAALQTAAADQIIEDHPENSDRSLNSLQADINRLEEKIDSLDDKLDRIIAGVGEISGAQPNHAMRAIHAEPTASTEHRHMIDKIHRLRNVRNFLQSLNDEELKKFGDLLEIAVAKAVDYGVEPGMIGGYVGQPKRYNNRPQVIFGKFGFSGRSKSNSRIFGIAIPDGNDPGFTIIISNRNKGPNVLEEEIIPGDDCFAPLDVSAFLENPDHYFV